MNYRNFIIKLIIVGCFLFNNYFAQGFLRVDGEKIVNDVNTNVILKGMGLGGWLVQEGYMLKTGRLDAEHQIRKGVEELVGVEKGEELYQLYRKNYVQKIDIDKMAEWGFNSIRLPMHWNKLISEILPLTYNEEGFKTIDTLLTWCKANSMYLILDLHAAPGGQSAGGIADYDPNQKSLWESEVNKDLTVNLWRTIAERYKDEEWIGGYDLINEPAWELGEFAPALRELYIRITNAIREVDNNHIVFIEGNWYATTFNGLMPPWDDNMVYSFHKYWNETDQGTINYLVTIRSTYNRPLWLGETGENSNEWFRETVKLMADNNIGWAWWPHKKIDNISAPLSVPIVEGYQQLIDYWNGNGLKPSETLAYNVLTNQFNALKYENCILQDDVHKSLLQPKPTVSSPFKIHNVPGIIYGSDYDSGGLLVGYNDSDYKNTGGVSGPAYNSGYAYRNDGVDIEKCTDTKTNGYNIGWINTGEWLKFTVNIADSGNYDLNFRFASTSTTGKFMLDIDSENIVGFTNIPNSNGWQNWQTLTVKDVFLQAGEHKLKLKFFFEGYNYNYLEITSAITSIENENLVPAEYRLYQNYPNPFNGETIVKYTIPKKSYITIGVYDITGRLIDNLFDGEKNPGNFEVKWNSNDIASGVYLIKLSTDSGIKKIIKTQLLK